MNKNSINEPNNNQNLILEENSNDVDDKKPPSRPERIKKEFDEKYRSLEEKNMKLKEEIEKLNKNSQDFLELQQEKERIEQEKEIAVKQVLEEMMKVLEEKDDAVKNLEQAVSELSIKASKYQSAASKYQSALGAATTFRLGDDDKNNPVQLNDDISLLQDDIEDYVTNLRPNIDINIKNINNLLDKYKSKIKLTSSKDRNDIPLIKAVLQRHVLQTILEYFPNYPNRKFGRKYSNEYALEAQLVEKERELKQLIEKLTATRIESDIVTSAISVKIRQQIYVALGSRGFSDIYINDKQKNEHDLHDFIKECKEKLNKEMESHRKILDQKKKTETDEKAAGIIRKVFRLFIYRFNTQEPIPKFRWFENNDDFDSDQMTSWDEEIENAHVEICAFPLIYRDTSPRQIYTRSIVFISENYSPSSVTEESKVEKTNPILNFFLKSNAK